MQPLQRLQKIISASGAASRRKAEQLILEGRVTVNGQVVRELGTRADAAVDYIKVDGRLLSRRTRKVYLLLNKPDKVICTMSDPEGRTRVTDLVRVKERVYPVGRLDYHTEGLILLTNDGEFARMVGSAGDAVPKVYHVKVKDVLDPQAMMRLREGIRLQDGTRCAPIKIRPIRESKNSWYEVTLVQGKNQQIRRMFQKTGNPVMKLRRVAIGFLKNERLPVGGHRHLTPKEVERFMAVGTTHADRPSGIVRAKDRSTAPGRRRVGI